VREADEPRRPFAIGQHVKGVTHHARARHLTESPDVRKPRWAIAGLEDHRFLMSDLQSLQTLNEPPRLLEWPGTRLSGGFSKCGIDHFHHLPGGTGDNRQHSIRIAAQPRWGGLERQSQRSHSRTVDV